MYYFHNKDVFSLHIFLFQNKFWVFNCIFLNNILISAKHHYCRPFALYFDTVSHPNLIQIKFKPNFNRVTSNSSSNWMNEMWKPSVVHVLSSARSSNLAAGVLRDPVKNTVKKRDDGFGVLTPCQGETALHCVIILNGWHEHGVLCWEMEGISVIDYIIIQMKSLLDHVLCLFLFRY